MQWLLMAGGVGGPFTFLFGLVALLNAALLARRPNARRRAIVAAMSRATIFAGLAALCGGFISTMLAAGHDPGAVDTSVLVLGFAESLASPVLGFALVSLTAMLEAIAARREEG